MKEKIINCIIKSEDYIDNNFEIIILILFILGIVTQSLLVYVFGMYGLLWYIIGLVLLILHSIKENVYKKSDIIPLIILSLSTPYFYVLLIIPILSKHCKFLQSKWKNKYYRRKKIIDKFL